MQLVRRFRIPALFCALAVLVCELIARAFTTMGVADDGSYILITQTLAATGHVVYNGNTTPLLGWQLYLGAAFVKLLGFSFITVRLSTLLVALSLSFLLQRTLVRAGIHERNATLATLAFVLSPMYLLLSATFMTDITGLFAILLCLYGCLRALQSPTPRVAIAWLCFAVTTNALCGTSRQIAWLGVLVMVPSTLWLLRAHRRVVLAGAAATLAGVLFILACMLWFLHQPYNVHEPLLPSTFPIIHVLSELIHLCLDAPFLLLPIVALFLPQLRNGRRGIQALFAITSVAYALLLIHWRHSHTGFLLEPTQTDWVGVHGIYESMALHGHPPIFLHPWLRVLLTIASLGGALGLFSSFFRPQNSTPRTQDPRPPSTSATISWSQLGMLLTPFTLAYSLLLIPRATVWVPDRYLLALLMIALLCLVRYYQDQIHSQLPLASVVFVGLMAIYGTVVLHNTFAIYHARVTLAAEIHSSGVPDTSVDNGWETNYVVELQHSHFLNDFRMVLPANAYVPTPPPPPPQCAMNQFDETPHIHPLYSVSFDPNACYGPAPFAPMHYSRWFASAPGTLYVVRSTPPAQP